MNKIKDMSAGAMIIAIIALMTLVPQLGFISINVVNITLIHLPVLIVALSFKNPKMALIAGTTFGVCSWINSMIRPTSPVQIFFQNPLVSVIPRILFALLAFYLFNLLLKKTNKIILSQFSAITISLIFHTLSVVSLLFLFNSGFFKDGFLTFLQAIILSNGILELIIALIIVPPVSNALAKQLGGR